MKRKVLSIALPLTLMLGVGCSKEEEQVKETDSLEVSQNDVSSTNSMSNYQKEVMKLTNDWSNLYLEISRKTSVGGDFKDVQSELSELRMLTKQIEDIQAPDKYKKSQAKLKVAIKDYFIAVNESVSYLISSSNSSTIDYAGQRERASKKFTEVLDEIRGL
ncbi:hypothetical protein [Bacillus toyonensis]|uniref:hypothetical protein n=1 Tax=Bacillus toyonensis TaxID=155322 RepID=UPI000BF68B76|nr:hypothetical protein [Bacillus toyonensis]PGF05288.1 hypothetical protein COM61_02435 [Bacillus toyonensis]